MSFSCITNYWAENFSQIIGQFDNGEFRVVSLRDVVQTDSRGFANSNYQSNMPFSSCTWTGKRAEEKEAAAVVRGLDFYEITAAQKANGASVVVSTGDRIDLRLTKGASDFKTLEVVSVVNQSNVAWIVWAIEAQ